METNKRSLQDWDKSVVTFEGIYQPRPPKVYTVEKIISMPSLSGWFGIAESLKTFLAHDLAVNVSIGRTWLGAKPGSALAGQSFQTKKSNVMLIDFDNGRQRTLDRLQALGKAYNVPKDAGMIVQSFPLPILNLTRDDHAIDLALRLLETGTELLVIDNLATVSGGVDENSAEIMKVMGNLRMITENAQCSIIVIHHSRKSNGIKGYRGDNLRGFSGIRGALDVLLNISRDPATGLVTVTSEKSRDADIPTFSAQFEFTHKTGTNELETARFYSEPYIDITTQANLKKYAQNERIEKDILTALDKIGPMSKNEITKQVRGKRETVCDIIDDLENGLAINVIPDGKALKCEITTIGRGLL